MARLSHLLEDHPRPARVGLPGRVMFAAFVAIFACLATGAVMLVGNARRSVDAELVSAMASASQTARVGLQDAASSPTPDIALRRLVRVFDGNRHVRAIWLNDAGAPRLTSRPDAALNPPPAWFVRLINPRAEPQLVGPIRLEPVPVNEVGDVWTGLGHVLLIATLLSILALVLIRQTVREALAPLEKISGVLARVGAGDFEVRAPMGGVTEMAQLATEVNAMAGQLATVDRENHQLHEQLATAQEEERAEIARDLHDEIGPYLFAVNIDAGAISALAADQPTAIQARADLIQAAVAHMQTHVGDMLRRLHPTRAVEFGLVAAVQDLVAFWRARRPDITFELTLDLDDDALGFDVCEAYYRVAQEALSNAVRHGAPTRVSMEVRVSAGDVAMLRVTDNGEARAGPADRPRFGLMGMRERLRALGGHLVVDTAGRGWTITAQTPLSPR